jgi:hypothetical protein
MRTYRIEIERVSDGKRVTMPVPGCGWTDDAPEYYRTRMCDCNLAGYFMADIRLTNKGWSQTPHQACAQTFIQNSGCDHSVPPTRFRPVAAHFEDGGTFVFT